MSEIRLSKTDREILERVAAGWRPLRAQIIPDGGRLERRGLLRLDWGPEDTPDAERMCWYLTDRARMALTPARQTPSTGTPPR
jgi:hypothetical protein